MWVMDSYLEVWEDVNNYQLEFLEIGIILRTKAQKPNSTSINNQEKSNLQEEMAESGEDP